MLSATVTSGGTTVGGVLQLAMFTPVGFTDILSLEWVSSPDAQFDNIVVVPQVAPPAPVPDPGPPAPAPDAGDATLEIRRASLDLKGHGEKHERDDRFSVVGDFVLSSGSDGIDVPNEEVEVTFGTFSVTIPAAPIEVGFRVGDDAGTATITLNRRGKFKR